MKKYLAVEWSARPITVTEIERETDSSVWIKGRRLAKLSDSGGYFNTFQEAQNHLLSKAQEKVNTARRSLEYANAKYGNIKGLREDK